MSGRGSPLRRPSFCATPHRIPPSTRPSLEPDSGLDLDTRAALNCPAPSPSSQTAFRFRLDSKFRPHPSAFVADPSSSARENNPPLQLLAGRLLSPSTFSTLFRPTTIVPISLLYVAAASLNQPPLGRSILGPCLNAADDLPDPKLRDHILPCFYYHSMTRSSTQWR